MFCLYVFLDMCINVHCISGLIGIVAKVTATLHHDLAKNVSYAIAIFVSKWFTCNMLITMLFFSDFLASHQAYDKKMPAVDTFQVKISQDHQCHLYEGNMPPSTIYEKEHAA